MSLCDNCVMFIDINDKCITDVECMDNIFLALRTVITVPFPMPHHIALISQHMMPKNIAHTNNFTQYRRIKK